MQDWRISRLKYYLNLPKVIELIDLKIRSISGYFYATHSLIGTVIFDRESNSYQLPLPVEYCVADIIGAEKAYLIEKNRLIRRLELFNEEITTEEAKRLTVDLYADLELLEKALNWIDELDFYIESHIQQNNLIKLDDFRLDIPKIDALKNEEDELLEMFNL